MNDKRKIIICASILSVVLPILLMFSVSKILRQSRPKTEIKSQIENISDDVSIEERVLVLNQAGKVEEMDMNAYLTSVVLCEMPASFEIDALKAQAVVARTYTLRRREAADKHNDADVCMDPGCCQGYISVSQYLSNGGTAISVGKVEKAVADTNGEVLLYDGALIEATYFSCSGGMTEDAVAVWGSEIPYLKATESPGEESATYFTATQKFTVAEFEDKLGRDLEGNPATWIERISYTSGGGVDNMRICGKDYKGTELRSLLSLRSTSFVVTAVGDSITITTKGFGHRVGMSQYGADAMAVQGSDYKEILLHYYSGTQLGTIKENN